jgi:hypothetical protein
LYDSNTNIFKEDNMSLKALKKILTNEAKLDTTVDKKVKTAELFMSGGKLKTKLEAKETSVLESALDKLIETDEELDDVFASIKEDEDFDTWAEADEEEMKAAEDEEEAAEEKEEAAEDEEEAAEEKEKAAKEEPVKEMSPDEQLSVAESIIAQLMLTDASELLGENEEEEPKPDMEEEEEGEEKEKEVEERKMPNKHDVKTKASDFGPQADEEEKYVQDPGEETTEEACAAEEGEEEEADEEEEEGYEEAAAAEEEEDEEAEEEEEDEEEEEEDEE